MSHRDAEDLAAEIAYMQDDPSFRPKKDPLNEKEPKDLLSIIERLEWRNEKLHKYIIRLEGDLIKEREDHIKLKQKIDDLVNEYRNKGKIWK